MKKIVKFIAVGLSICTLTNNVVKLKAMDLNSFPIEGFKGQIANNTFKKQIPIEFVHEHLINVIEELQDGCNNFRFNNNENETQDNDNHNEKLTRGLFELIFEIVEDQFILNEKGEYTFDDGIPFLYQITSMVIDRLKKDERINSLAIKDLNKQFEAFCGSAEFFVDNVYYNKISKNIPAADWRYLTSSMLKAAIKNNSYKASNFLGSEDEYDMYLLDILVKDDLDAFKKEQAKWSLPGSAITEKKFDVCFNINCLDNREKLKTIDLSALLGSEKIFKSLLLLQYNKLERNTYKYALSGGNTYIIRIAENILNKYDVTNAPNLYINEIICAIRKGQINVAAHFFNEHIMEFNSFRKEDQEMLSKSIASVLCCTYNVLLIDCMLLNSRINKSDLKINNKLIKIKYKPLTEYFANMKLLFNFQVIKQIFNPDNQWLLDFCKSENFGSEWTDSYFYCKKEEIFQYLEEGSILERIKFLTTLLPNLTVDITSKLLYLAVQNQDLESIKVLLNAILGGSEYIEDVCKLLLAIKNDEIDNFHNLTKKLNKDVFLKIRNQVVFLFVQKENMDGIDLFLNQGINKSMLLFIVDYLSTEKLRRRNFKYKSHELAIISISTAIRKNDLEKVKYLLEHTINKEKLFNGPLLYKVMDCISAEMLQLLIDEGENLYLGNPLCDKIFSHAVKENCLKVVEFLLERNLCSQDFVKWFDLIKILKCHLRMDLTLPQKMEIICDYTNKSHKDTQIDFDNNILFSNEILNNKINELCYLPEHEKNIAKRLYIILETESERNKLKFLHKLIIEVGDPRVLEKDGTTLLHYLVMNSNNKDITQLLQHKYKLVDLNATDKDGKTALYIAVKLGNFDIVKALIESGANIKEAIFDLATGNDQMIDFFLNLINLGDLRILEKDGTSVLHYLVKNSNKKDIKQFLNRIHKSVDLNTTDKDGQTALSLAVKLGKFDAVKALIKHGADTNIPIRDLARGNTEMIDFFLDLLNKFNIN